MTCFPYQEPFRKVVLIFCFFFLFVFPSKVVLTCRYGAANAATTATTFTFIRANSFFPIFNFLQILPGIKLGVLVIDSCDSPHHALEQTIDFIKVKGRRKNIAA